VVVPNECWVKAASTMTVSGSFSSINQKGADYADSKVARVPIRKIPRTGATNAFGLGIHINSMKSEI
jgi:hypothetical protein